MRRCAPTPRARRYVLSIGPFVVGSVVLCSQKSISPTRTYVRSLTFAHSLCPTYIEYVSILLCLCAVPSSNIPLYVLLSVLLTHSSNQAALWLFVRSLDFDGQLRRPRPRYGTNKSLPLSGTSQTHSADSYRIWI